MDKNSQLSSIFFEICGAEDGCYRSKMFEDKKKIAFYSFHFLLVKMTKIEEQENAINKLKANLMDDLTERGLLSDPECKRILQIHKEVS